jgi:hypothetical protein
MLALGALLVILPVVAWTIQLLLLKLLIVPWYVPALGLAGAIVAVTGLLKSPSIGRGIPATIIAGLGVLEAFFVVRETLLPRYRGPIAIGTSFPTFSAQRADGATFTDVDLPARPTVLTFFRGRW